MHGARTETISLVAVRQIRPRWNAEAGQNQAQNISSEDPVAVVVAKDRDPLPIADGGQHAVDGADYPRN